MSRDTGRTRCALPRVGALRNRRGGKNADDDDNDEQFDQSETVPVLRQHCS
jgi:hypothetical protein